MKSKPTRFQPGWQLPRLALKSIPNTLKAAASDLAWQQNARTLRPKPAPTNAETSDTIRRCHQAINTLVTHLEGNGWLDNAEATGLRDTIRRDLYGKGEAA
ncbi:MAG: hypothetical protein U0Y68_08140 [Blastocatellia bacterium]